MPDRLRRHDPLALVHARALLTSTPEGATDYVDADLHDPDTILEAATATLDLAQPVALMLMGILGHVADYEQARSIVRRLLGGLTSGSYFALNDGTNVISTAFEQAQEGYNRSRAVPYILRSPQQIAGFFEGLELVEPGWCRARALAARSRRGRWRSARRGGCLRRSGKQAPKTVFRSLRASQWL